MEPGKSRVHSLRDLVANMATSNGLRCLYQCKCRYREDSQTEEVLCEHNGRIKHVLTPNPLMSVHFLVLRSIWINNDYSNTTESINVIYRDVTLNKATPSGEKPRPTFVWCSTRRKREGTLRQIKVNKVSPILQHRIHHLAGYTWFNNITFTTHYHHSHSFLPFYKFWITSLPPSMILS